MSFCGRVVVVIFRLGLAGSGFLLRVGVRVEIILSNHDSTWIQDACHENCRHNGYGMTRSANAALPIGKHIN